MPMVDPQAEQLVWCLEQCGGDRRRLVVTSPCVVGYALRQAGLASAKISEKHAELFLDGEQLYVRDLGSTHGTRVNSLHVLEACVQEGDILEFADCSFRLLRLFGASGKFRNALLIYSEGRLVGYVTSPVTETLELGFSTKIRGLWHAADTQEAVAFDTKLRRGGHVEVTVDGHPFVTGARTLISAAADGEVWLVSTGRPNSR